MPEVPVEQGVDAEPLLFAEKEETVMGDLDVAAKVRAVERLRNAEARYAEAEKACSTFDADVALTALKEQLQTSLENARRELELAKADAEAASCDEAAKAAVVAQLATEMPDLRTKG